MAYELTIGSTMFDAAGTASTIAGTRVMFGSAPEDPLTLDDNSGQVRLPFRIEVVAPDAATLAARLADVHAALDDAATHGVVVSEDAVAFVQVLPADYERVHVERRALIGPDGAASLALLECAVVADSIDAGGGASPGAVSSTWTYQRNQAGRGLAIGRITAATRAAAVAAIQPLVSHAARPAWMSSAFRYIEDTAEFDAAPGDAHTLPDDSFRPCTITVVFEQMAAWMASDPRFNAVRKAECVFDATPREPVPVRAGQVPGYNVTVRGTITLHTERNTSWDSLEPSPVAASAMRATAEAVAQAMLEEAERRLGSGPVTLLLPLESSVVGEDGVYTVTLVGVTHGPSRVLSWTESEMYEEATRDEIVDLAGPGQWVFGRKPLITIQHTLSIESLVSARPYVPPVSLARRPAEGSWKQMSAIDSPPEVSDAGPGAARRVSVTYRRVYQFIFSGGAGGGGGGRTVARP